MFLCVMWSKYARFIILTVAVLTLNACTTLPLNKLPLGGVVHSVVVHDSKSYIDFYSLRRAGAKETKIKDYSLISSGPVGAWEISVAEVFANRFQQHDMGPLFRKYDLAMDSFAPYRRPARYQITVVPSNLTYRVKTRHDYTDSLITLAFIVSIDDDASFKRTFQKIFQHISHEQYHLYQRMDIQTKPVDRISREALAYFVSQCMLNQIFMEISDPHTKFRSIKNFNLEGTDRAQLREYINPISKSRDNIKQSWAGQIIMLFLFEKMMAKSTKSPAEFSAELDGFCTVIGEDTPASWGELLNRYESYQFSAKKITDAAMKSQTH